MNRYPIQSTVRDSSEVNSAIRNGLVRAALGREISAPAWASSTLIARRLHESLNLDPGKEGDVQDFESVVVLMEDGNYSVRVTNVVGSVTSAPVASRVIEVARLDRPPASQSVTLGQRVEFTAAALGTWPFRDKT